MLGTIPYHLRSFGCRTGHLTFEQVEVAKLDRSTRLPEYLPQTGTQEFQDALEELYADPEELKENEESVEPRKLEELEENEE